MMRTHRCEVIIACIQGAISDELVETETTPATSSITRPGPLKEYRAQIAQGVEQAKDVDENFVDDGKAEGHAESVAGPVEVESSGIAVPVGRKYNGKSDQLGEDVAEEKLEFAVASRAEA